MIRLFIVDDDDAFVIVAGTYKGETRGFYALPSDSHAAHAAMVGVLAFLTDVPDALAAAWKVSPVHVEGTPWRVAGGLGRGGQG